MDELQIEKSKAIEAYNNADNAGKQLLANLFGENTLNQKITDRIKTYEDACHILGIDDPVQRTLEFIPDGFEFIALQKLFIIARALNEGWAPNWTNSSEYKYYPWFNMSSGSGLSYGGCDIADTNAHVGSRLCFKSKELAEYAGRQFIDLYKAYFCL